MSRIRVNLSLDPNNPDHLKFLEIVRGQKYMSEYVVRCVLGNSGNLGYPGNQKVTQTAYLAKKQIPEEKPKIAQDVLEMMDW